ncbi:unnamed protein product [Acanthoscelides obtectus]|uniref:Uncharacterized protein n=1 Tax=Acanthoscelides obtectus TaxID=200917 RepID=A0A9P0KY94_ACAOB|nr:unnamed protein product [Acanthoscelides obtectus]CAK1633704.1 hypothetical protein AOBTE_LOCUS8331 [Acanthoscelides obtectus]
MYIFLEHCKRRKHELFVKRNKEGCFNLLLNQFCNNDTKFIEYFRVSKEQFTRVLKLIENDITRQPSKRYRNPISAAEKLGVTVRKNFIGYTSLSKSHKK